MPEVEDTIRRLSCVQLDSISTVERSHRITLGSRVGALPGECGLAAAGPRPGVRVLGARGLPAAGRGLAAVRQRDAKRRPALVRRGGADPSSPGRARSSEEIRTARPVRLSPLRGRDGRAGCGAGSRPSAMLERALEPRRSRDRRPSGVPAALRPARARAPACGARCADARPAGAAARRSRSRRCAHAGALTEAGIVEHWRLRGGARADSRDRGRARRRRPRSSACRSTTEARPSSSPHGTEPGRRRADGGGAALAVRQPALGPPVRAPRARLRPPDRGLQARSRSAATATTSCRSSGATASSAAPT